MKRFLAFVILAFFLGGCVTVQKKEVVEVKGANIQDIRGLITDPVVDPVPKAR